MGLVSTTMENAGITRDALLTINNSPYTTDPVSDRVVEMAMYVRKD